MRDWSITPGLYLLTAICGVIDATCFLALGDVFAEVMTGNIMFLAFEIGQGRGVEAFPIYTDALIAICSVTHCSARLHLLAAISVLRYLQLTSAGAVVLA